MSVTSAVPSIVSDRTFSSTFPYNSTSNVSIAQGCLVKQVSQFVAWDNKDNLISKQVDVIVNILCTGVLLPLCFLVSFSTNVVNMVVFYKQGLRERINVCLFTLSIVDLLYVVTVYGYSSDVPYMFILGKGDTIGPSAIFFVQSHLIGMIGFANSSQIVSSVIALERCLCVTRPLLVKHLLLTRRTTAILWSLILVLTAAIFVCDGMHYEVICVFDTADNSISYQLYPSGFYFQNQYVIDLFSGFVFGFLFPGLCAVCVTVCTVITVVKMKKLATWRETVTSASDSLSSRDLAITRMIVGTSTLFIVCVIPSFAVRASLLVVPELRVGGRYENLYFVFIRFFLLSSVINSTFNFFVYYVYGSKFRQTVKEMFALHSRCHGNAND